VPNIHFPNIAPARPSDTGLAAAQAFQTNRNRLRDAQAMIRTVAQELAQIDNQDDDFNPTSNEVTVVGRSTSATLPATRPGYEMYRNANNNNTQVDAEVKYGEDGELKFFNGQLKSPDYPQYPVTVTYERKETKKGIPFINRHKVTVQEYRVTDSLGTSYSLKLNEGTGVLTTS
jgi:hypothetical protein